MVTEITDVVKIEHSILLSGTQKAINRARHLLYIISAIAGFGLAQLFLWHFSWDIARESWRAKAAQQLWYISSDSTLIEDRLDSLSHLRHLLFENLSTDTRSNVDSIKALAARIDLQAASINNRRVNRAIDLPLLGLHVGVQDLPPILSIISVVLLSWLIFSQKQVNECLIRIIEEVDTVIPGNLLQFHFILIRARKDRGPFQRLAPRLLIMALPMVLVCFLFSDLWDIYFELPNSASGRVALSFIEFRNTIIIRQLVLLASIGLTTYLSIKSLLAFKKTESTVMEIAEKAKGN